MGFFRTEKIRNEFLAVVTTPGIVFVVAVIVVGSAAQACTDALFGDGTWRRYLPFAATMTIAVAGAMVWLLRCIILLLPEKIDNTE